MKVQIVGVAWYRADDYDTLKRLFADGDRLPSTYEEWLDKAEGFTSQLARDGHAFEKVYIDPETFPAWCAARGLDIDSKARVRFSNEAVAARKYREQN